MQRDAALRVNARKALVGALERGRVLGVQAIGADRELLGHAGGQVGG